MLLDLTMSGGTRPHGMDDGEQKEKHRSWDRVTSVD